MCMENAEVGVYLEITICIGNHMISSAIWNK